MADQTEIQDRPLSYELQQAAGPGTAGSQVGMATGGSVGLAAGGITGWGVGMTGGIVVGLIAGMFLSLAILSARSERQP